MKNVSILMFNVWSLETVQPELSFSQFSFAEFSCDNLA